MAVLTLLVLTVGWKYVRPELADVIKEEKVKAVERQKLAAELKAKAPKISPAQQNAKDSFFAERYKKIKTMQPSKAAAATLPRLGDFLSLPSVEPLYQDLHFGTSNKDAQIEEDIDTWGKEHLDDVLDDAQSFAVDTRFEALKLILAATSEDPDSALDGLDIDALQEYDDDFFLRPSSWLSCGLCTSKFGPLPTVLQHIHDEHPLVRPPSGEVSRPPVLELSLEVACAFSAVLELAGLDGDDCEVTSDELTEKLDDHMLLYENAPKGVKKRGTWIQLVRWRAASDSPFIHQADDAMSRHRRFSVSRSRLVTSTSRTACSMCPSLLSRTSPAASAACATSTPAAGYTGEAR